MASLYQRLFTYRERQGRSPLEDFLSEALADLLNRLPEATARDAVAHFLGGRADALNALERAWPPGKIGYWTTQRAIDGGRLVDLILEIDGQPALVLENKIGAGFQKHFSSDPKSGEAVSQHQLATYGQWLAQKADPDWGGALVLLTHWTPAPSDFESSTEVYKCRFRSTVRWADFCRWLSGRIRLVGDKKSDWAQLGGELITFLKEQNMDSELATGQDLAALQIYVASADRVRNSVEQLWENAKPLWKSLCMQTSIPLEISTEYGCVWKFRYLSRPDLRESYLAVGIRYPGLTDHVSYVDPQGEPYLFVELGSNDDGSPIDSLAMPEGWSVSDDLRLAKRPLRDLPSDPDLFMLEAKAWTSDRIGEVARELS